MRGDDGLGLRSRADPLLAVLERSCPVYGEPPQLVVGQPLAARRRRLRGLRRWRGRFGRRVLGRELDPLERIVERLLPSHATVSTTRFRLREQPTFPGSPRAPAVRARGGAAFPSDLEGGRDRQTVRRAPGRRESPRRRPPLARGRPRARPRASLPPA